MVTESELLYLADCNMAEANREQARWLPPTLIEERETQLFVACGTRFPIGPFNSALATTDQPDAGAFLAAARGHYHTLGRGFTIYARAHHDGDIIRACEAAGYRCLGESPGMVLTELTPQPVLAKGVDIRTVEDPAQAAAFADVVATAFEALSMPAAVTGKLLSQSDHWLAPHWHVKLLYEQGRAVCGAMLLFSHGIAGIYWVGTLPEVRGRGYADAVVRVLSNHAFTLGARAVVLQASKFGEPVYRRVGYREITKYPWYLVPAPD